MLTWGEKIKRQREQAKISQYQVSQRSEIGRDKISRFECGYTEPSGAERARVERVLYEMIAEQQALLAELQSKDKRSAPKTSGAQMTLTI